MGHTMTNFAQHEVGAFEAKNKLGTLLDWVEAGDEVIITRRGRAVARMVSATARHNRDDARPLSGRPARNHALVAAGRSDG